VTPSKVFAF
jgi:hypothetical protein